MTSDQPAASARRLGDLGPRREMTMIVLLGAIGAGLVFLAMRQGWAHVATAVPAPLPVSVVKVTGQGLVPYADALAIAALASLAAVLATRRAARRAAGVLLAGLGVGIAAAVNTGVSTVTALAAAAGNIGPGTGSGAGTTAGSVTEGGAQTGTAVPEVAGFHAHATLTATAWQALATLGAVAIVAAGVLVIWRARRLPVMSSRYDAPTPAAPGETAREAPRETAPEVAQEVARDAAGADSASLWESLSRGEDPTGAGAGRTG
jgi:uncharacterized membrane protein (TIGR02234 family)